MCTERTLNITVQLRRLSSCSSNARKSQVVCERRRHILSPVQHNRERSWCQVMSVMLWLYMVYTNGFTCVGEKKCADWSHKTNSQPSSSAAMSKHSIYVWHDLIYHQISCYESGTKLCRFSSVQLPPTPQINFNIFLSSHTVPIESCLFSFCAVRGDSHLQYCTINHRMCSFLISDQPVILPVHTQ